MERVYSSIIIPQHIYRYVILFFKSDNVFERYGEIYIIEFEFFLILFVMGDSLWMGRVETRQYGSFKTFIISVLYIDADLFSS